MHATPHCNFDLMSPAIAHVCVTRVAVRLTLVDSRIGGEEVEVLFAVHVPDVRPQTALQHHRQRGVVVGANTLLQLTRTHTHTKRQRMPGRGADGDGQTASRRANGRGDVPLRISSLPLLLLLTSIMLRCLGVGAARDLSKTRVQCAWWRFRAAVEHRDSSGNRATRKGR